MTAARRWPLACVALTLLWFFPYQEPLNNPNENVRVYQTRAIVEEGTLAIGRRVLQGGRLVDRGGVVGEWGWVNDKALVCDEAGARPPCAGTLLPAKAPGVSLLGVPPYAVLSWLHHRIAGGPPSKRLTVRVLRLTVITLPFLLLLVLLRRRLVAWLDGDQRAAELAVLSLGLGSVATPYALIFAGHALAGVALAGGLLALLGGAGRARRSLAGGLLLALAVAIEYPMALPAALLGVVGVLAAGRGRRWPALAWAALGGLPVVLGLAAYHTAALGHPFATAYDFLENPAFVRDASPGLHGVAVPGLDSLLLGLFSPQAGLLFFSPASLLAPLGAWRWLRGRGASGAGRASFQNATSISTCITDTAEPAPDAVAAAARERRWLGLALLGVAVTFLGLVAAMPNLRRMLGWTVGPRYIAAVAPFAACGLAAAASWLGGRWPRAGVGLAAGLVLVGLVLCGVPALLYPHYPMEFRNPSFQLGLPLLLGGWLPESLGTALGLASWPAALPGLLAAGAVVLAVLLPGDRPGGARWTRTSRAGSLAALLVAATLLAAFSLPGRPLRSTERRQREWVQRRWEPRPVAHRTQPLPPARR